MDDANEVPNEDKQALAAPEGVKNKDLSASESHSGSKAPVINNTAPPKEPTAEEKAAADKAAADKTASDEAAAKATTEKEAADKKAAEEEAAKNKEPLKEYPTYDDPAATSVVNLLKKAGITPEESDAFFSKAVESGKLDDVDLAALEAKVGKDEAALIMIGVTQYYNNNQAAVKKVTDAIHGVFGGKEQTDTVTAWAIEKEKTDTVFSTELDEYRRMFDGSPVQARLAAEALLKAFNADPKTRSLVTKITEGDGKSSALDLGYISRADYTKAITDAENKGDKREAASLRARRTVSIQQEKSGQR